MTQDAFYFFTILLAIAGLALEVIIVVLAYNFKAFLKQQVADKGTEVVSLLNRKGE